MLARCAALAALVACVTDPAPTCEDFAADMRSGVMERATFGVRFVAPLGFAAAFGAPTFPLSTGVLVMEPWILNGEIGAVGIGVTGHCYWYAPREERQ